MIPRCGDFALQHALLDRLVRGDERRQSVDALRRYFRVSGPREELFTGRWFDRFAGGGCTPAVVNTITAADVLALTHLSVLDLSELAVVVLERRATEITALLRDIPLLTMHEVGTEQYEAILGEQSPAWRLWQLLRTSAGGNRWVAANKLLARKRPQLLPVYDHVVADMLQRPANVWSCLWCWFQGDPSRVTAVDELRADVGGVEDISLLRCLDVVLWMRRRNGDPPS